MPRAAASSATRAIVIWSSDTPLRIAIGALALACVAGCGYKGPLYLPDAKTKDGKPATVILPEPAPDRPIPSESAPAPK